MRKRELLILGIIVIGFIISIGLYAQNSMTGNVVSDGDGSEVVEEKGVGEDGLAFYYKFENNAVDEISGKEGVMDGVGFDSGKIGRAGKFEKNDFINAGSGSNINNIKEITITAWIYVNSFGDNGVGYVVSKKRKLLFIVDLEGTKKTFQFNQLHTGFDGRWAAKSNIIDLKQWYHVAVTYDSDYSGNNPKFYLNGEEVEVYEQRNPSGNAYPDNSDDLLIGDNEKKTGGFDGKIDELKIWNKILTQEEIEKEYLGENIEEKVEEVVDGEEDETEEVVDGEEGIDVDDREDEEGIEIWVMVGAGVLILFILIILIRKRFK